MSEHESEATSTSREDRPGQTGSEELSEEGVGLTMGEPNTFEPEEEPDADIDTDPADPS